MDIIFSHGKESGPWGTKITRLANIAKSRGFNVKSIDYTHTTNPEERVRILNKVLIHNSKNTILVGSSMGGYASVVNSETHPIAGLFLLAPALYIDGYLKQSFTISVPTEIVHGWSDDVIPFQNSLRFANEQQCSLHLIAGDHRLNSSLAQIEMIFDAFLSSFIEKICSD